MKGPSFLKVFCAVALAIIVGQMAYNAIRDYSTTHILVKFRAIEFATGEKSDAVQVFLDRTSPFHQARGVHVYMISLLQKQDDQGYWQVIPVGNDSIQEGTEFIIYPDKREGYDLSWIMVCTTEELTTWKQVEQASWNKYLRNSSWFGAEVLPAISLQCK